MPRWIQAAAIVFLVAAESALPGEPMFERHLIASHEKVPRNCYPCMARLGDDRLMVVWSSRDGNRCHIVGAFSGDNGRTWSTAIPLIRTPSGRDYDPSIVVSANRVAVTSTTLPAGAGIRTSKTWCTRSDDHGRTWSELFQIPMNHRYTCGKTHHGLRLESGTLLMGYSWDVICEQGKTLSAEGEMHLRAGVMISTDNGQSWANGGDTDAAYEKVSGGAVHGTDEPAIVELPDGSIYMLMRTGSTHLYEARSSDEGRTWTGIRPSPLRGTNAPAALCQFDAAGKRGIMCIWDNARTRYPLCGAASFDGGRSWSRPRDIAGPTEGRQASYPSCEQAADGTLVAVWQQEVPDGRDVRSARFNPAWLLTDPLKELQKELARVRLPISRGKWVGYEGGDPVEALPPWTVHAAGGEVVSDGKLRLLPTGGYYLDNRREAWDGSKDGLVEFRMRVVGRAAEGNPGSAAEVWLGGSEPDSGCQVFFREDAVAFDRSYCIAHEVDTTAFHTYRLATSLAAGKAYLFIDHAEAPVLAASLGDPEGLSINRVLFGDSSRGSSEVSGTSEWEFVRWQDLTWNP